MDTWDLECLSSSSKMPRNKDSLTKVSHWLKMEQSSFLRLQIKIAVFSRGNIDNMPVKIYTLKYLMVPLTFGLQGRVL